MVMRFSPDSGAFAAGPFGPPLSSLIPRFSLTIFLSFLTIYPLPVNVYLWYNNERPGAQGQTAGLA
jgi:hypothetical protein